MATTRPLHLVQESVAFCDPRIRLAASFEQVPLSALLPLVGAEASTRSLRQPVRPGGTHISGAPGGTHIPDAPGGKAEADKTSTHQKERGAAIRVRRTGKWLWKPSGPGKCTATGTRASQSWNAMAWLSKPAFQRRSKGSRAQHGQQSPAVDRAVHLYASCRKGELRPDFSHKGDVHFCCLR